MAAAEAFCPYVGLQPYTEADRDYFFGRERDQRIIASNLYASPLTVLYGASGVGKSSVLLAGVVPYLRARPRTAVIVFREWQDDSFLNALKNGCLEAVAASLNKPLAIDGRLPLDDLLATAARSLGGTILIVFDQFEEYFLYHPEAETGPTFDSEFARAVNREDVDVGFLLALREDGLSKLDRFRARIPNLLGNLLRLQHLTAADAEEAIRKPLAVYNERFSSSTAPVAIEDELVGALLAQVRTGRVTLSQAGGVGHAQLQDDNLPVEAPFLQLVVTRLWDEEMKAHSNRLRLDTLRNLGGAQEIVRTHLDGVMVRLDATEHEVCSLFFDRLVTPSGSKIACRVADLTEWAGSFASHVPAVLKRLSDNRILRGIVNPGEPNTASSYEIYHDVLAPAILDWRIRHVREQERIEAARKAAAEAVAKQQQALHQRELEHAQSLFQEQQRRAETQTLSAKRLRRSLTALLCMFSVALGAALMAWLQSHRAMEQARIAASNELAAAAITTLDIDPELSILLALQAVENTYSSNQTVTTEADNALRRAVQTSRLQLTLRGHGKQIRAVAFSPDSTRLATAAWDDTAKVWDAATGNEVSSFVHDSDKALAFSPNGTRLAAANTDSAVKLWETATGQPLTPLGDPGKEITAIAFSRDDSRVAAASKHETVKVWDAAAQTESFTLPAPRQGQWVLGLAFSPDGGRLAITGADPPATRVWDVLDKREVFTLPDPSINNAVAFSPDGKRLATASRDKAAIVWDAESGQRLLVLAGHTDQVRDAAFSPDGTRLATASADRTARVWDAASGQLLFTLFGHTDWVHDVAFSPDGARLATASRDETVKVWNVTAHTSAVYGIAFSPDGKRLATASGDNTVKVWDVASGQAMLTIVGHADTVYKLAFSPDGKRLATASFDKAAKIWDVASGQEVRALVGHADQVRDIAFSPDGARLATASADRTAKIWDAESGKTLLDFPHDNQVQAIDFSPDGKKLATVSWDKTLRFWDAQTGRALLPPIEGKAGFNAVAFSPDGKRVATGFTSPLVRVWDATTGKVVLVLQGHADNINGIAFSPDGTRLATASGDKTVKLWDAATGKALQTWSVHTDVVNDVAFSPDGKLLATASSDKSFQVSPLAIEDLIALAERRVTRTLTDAECAKHLHVSPCPTTP